MNSQQVKELNETGDGGVVFELNYTADWTDKEYLDHMGVIVKLA